MDDAQALKAACERFESGEDKRFSEFGIYMDLMSEVLDEYFDAGADRQAMWSLSEPRRTAMVVDMLMGEVNNGGFEQYYDNTSGNGAAIAPDCLRRIGMPELAKVLERGNALFPDGPSMDRDEREEQIMKLGEKLSQHFAELDDAYFELSEPLNCRNVRYILEHQSEFFDSE